MIRVRLIVKKTGLKFTFQIMDADNVLSVNYGLGQIYRLDLYINTLHNFNNTKETQYTGRKKARWRG